MEVVRKQLKPNISDPDPRTYRRSPRFDLWLCYHHALGRKYFDWGGQRDREPYFDRLDTSRLKKKVVLLSYAHIKFERRREMRLFYHGPC